MELVCGCCFSCYTVWPLGTYYDLGYRREGEFEPILPSNNHPHQKLVLNQSLLQLYGTYTVVWLPQPHLSFTLMLLSSHPFYDAFAIGLNSHNSSQAEKLKTETLLIKLLLVKYI